MVIVRVNGGVGNQMFQYAAAKRLAHKHNTSLKLDISELVNEYGYHIYGLRFFNIREDFARTADIIRYFPAEGLRRFSSTVVGDKLTKLFFRKVLRDKSELLKRRYYNYDPASKEVPNLMVGRVVSQRFFHFDPEVLEVPDNVYMTGSFLSERYFEDIKELIMQEFTFKPEQSDEDERVYEKIKDSESVSIHIRRGDAIENSQKQAAYGHIHKDYYNACIDYIAGNIRNPYLFVFSDDMDWVKTNFKIPFPTHYVDHNYDSIDYRVDSSTDFQDMRLMSQCKHNIITNSTFGWWGGWLNRNPEKIVCAPMEFVRIWNFDNKDIVPDEWIRF